MRCVRNLFRRDTEVCSKFIQREWWGGLEIFSEGMVKGVGNLFRGDGEVGWKFIQRVW